MGVLGARFEAGVHSIKLTFRPVTSVFGRIGRHWRGRLVFSGRIADYIGGGRVRNRRRRLGGHRLGHRRGWWRLDAALQLIVSQAPGDGKKNEEPEEESHIPKTSLV